MKQFPKQFTIHGQLVKIIVHDEHDSIGRYGYYSDPEETIHIFKKILCDGNIIELEETQITNTFLHELKHVFQMYTLGKTDEPDATSFAGCMTEFLFSSNYDLVPTDKD